MPTVIYGDIEFVISNMPAVPVIFPTSPETSNIAAM